MKYKYIYIYIILLFSNPSPAFLLSFSLTVIAKPLELETVMRDAFRIEEGWTYERLIMST